MTTREQQEHRRDLVRHAPILPDEMPEPLRGPTRLTDILFPYVVALFKKDRDFREMVGSLNAENSPSGRLCFDDCRAAEMVQDYVGKNGAHPAVMNALLSRLSTAVKYCMRRVGLSRPQRIETAKKNLLTGNGHAAPESEPASEPDQSAH